MIGGAVDKLFSARLVPETIQNSKCLCRLACRMAIHSVDRTSPKGYGPGTDSNMVVKGLKADHYYSGQRAFKSESTDLILSIVLVRSTSSSQGRARYRYISRGQKPVACSLVQSKEQNLVTGTPYAAGLRVCRVRKGRNMAIRDHHSVEFRVLVYTVVRSSGRRYRRRARKTSLRNRLVSHQALGDEQQYTDTGRTSW